ncbi:hypothetical protein HD554DRAFT_2167946 [Boletus coccyginus]|nr:hypothetical protein HD554DRAFT_2167946 [Boletus coccyginus]
MRASVLFACLALPLFSAAQSSQVSTSPVFNTTITAAPSSASQSGSASGSGSATGSANITGSASATGNATATANATSTTILPTAPSTVAGADGGGPNGAPSPGTSASGGIYGPPDGYIASAEALRSAGMIGFVGLVVGGVLFLV